MRDATLKQMMANEDRFSDVPFADEHFAELEDCCVSARKSRTSSRLLAWI